MRRNNNSTIIYVILLVIVVTMIFLMMFTKVLGEEQTEAYIVCQPDSSVAVRETPRKTSFAGGELTIGDKVYLDGKKKNGYWHCVDMANEAGEGWVSCKYVTFEEPMYIYREATVISKGRLAARNSINGKVKQWLQPMSTLTLYYMMEEWCVTDKGYVRTQYLELD